MHINIYIPLTIKVLSQKVKEYKDTEEKEWIKIHDYRTHPNLIEKMWQMTLYYSHEDWIWFSEVFERPKDYIRMFWEYDINLKPYESKIIFTINRENFNKKWYYLWYKRIKDFIDFLWTDYIAQWESYHSVFDLETGEVIKLLT